jgi:small subunit ribosomal protein S11
VTGRIATNPTENTPMSTTTPQTPASEQKKKARVRKNVGKAIAHVKASFNNTIITVTDSTGQVLAWDSAGTIGYKGSRKSTPFAAQRAAEKVADKIRKMGVHELEVLVNGPGSGRESAIRALSNSGIEVKTIEDVTPLPHNGCRPRKRRRV